MSGQKPSAEDKAAIGLVMEPILQHAIALRAAAEGMGLSVPHASYVIGAALLSATSSFLLSVGIPPEAAALAFEEVATELRAKEGGAP